MNFKYTLLLLFIWQLCVLVSCLNNGAAITPGMGWNSWNHFGCGINEQLIRQTADAIVSSGLRDKGYEFVNLDDCWQISRDNVTEEIIADPDKFPSGIASLSAYVHSKGLKLGLYSDAGTNTCQGRPGSLGYEKIDAKTYANWAIDYLKYDNCYNKDLSPKERYPIMRDALNSTGRPIYFSMCEWGDDQPWKWAPDVGNSWRTTGDISDKWDSFTDILNKNADLYSYSSIGAWNDPDMLEVGNGGMTENEYIAHFSFWALLKAPLLIGCDVTNMSDSTLSILGNEEIIAIDQDPLGKQGKRITKGILVDTEVWAGELVNSQVAVILFNKSSKTETISFSFSKVGFSQDKAWIRDLVQKKDLGVFTNKYSQDVLSHQAIVLKLSIPTQQFLQIK